MQRVPLKKKEDGRIFRLRLAETADRIPALLAAAAQPAVAELGQFLAADCLAGQDAWQQHIENYDAVQHCASEILFLTLPEPYQPHLHKRIFC